MEMASGYYLNVFESNVITKHDIYVIFNEPNSEPTAEELTALTELIEQKLSESASLKDIQVAIEDSELECVSFGVRVLGR